MYLLFDECCPKSLVGIAQRHGHAAQRTIEVTALGPQASDADIFAFAYETRAVVVTVNRGDFLALAERQPDHAGLILLPSVPPMVTRQLFLSVLNICADDPLTGGIVSIDSAARVRRQA